jgi:Zn-dependent peptidase ImmA (M78 family)
MKIEEIDKMAEELVLKYNPEGFSPFPFEKIEADIPELKILYSDKLDPNISGAIIYEENIFAIIINKLKPETRMHFTIAHELGHYFLHKDHIINSKAVIDGESSLDGQVILYRDDNANRAILETEANNFAATLIMPEELVKEVWYKLKEVETCAKIFKVSVSAMSIRLERLKLL